MEDKIAAAIEARLADVAHQAVNDRLLAEAEALLKLSAAAEHAGVPGPGAAIVARAMLTNITSTLAAKQIASVEITRALRLVAETKVADAAVPFRRIADEIRARLAA